MNRKKGQMQEFLAIMLLVLGLVMFVVFNRLSSTEADIHKAETSYYAYSKENLWTGANIMLYSTFNGKMMVELLGYYICTDSDVISFGNNRNINISEVIITVLNKYYGPERWALSLSGYGREKCVTRGTLQNASCQPTPASYDFLFSMPCSLSTGSGTLYLR